MPRVALPPLDRTVQDDVSGQELGQFPGNRFGHHRRCEMYLSGQGLESGVGQNRCQSRNGFRHRLPAGQIRAHYVDSESDALPPHIQESPRVGS